MVASLGMPQGKAFGVRNLDVVRRKKPNLLRDTVTARSAQRDSTSRIANLIVSLDLARPFAANYCFVVSTLRRGCRLRVVWQLSDHSLARVATVVGSACNASNIAGRS